MSLDINRRSEISAQNLYLLYASQDMSCIPTSRYNTFYKAQWHAMTPMCCGCCTFSNFSGIFVDNILCDIFEIIMEYF